MSFFCIVSALCGMLFFSCADGKPDMRFLREDLFSINYGSFDDEIDIFDGLYSQNANTYLTMCDGFFFIANGKSKKIMKMTASGELISVIRNHDFSASASEEGSSEKSAADSPSRRISEYPFSTLGKVAVDSGMNVYVADTLPEMRQEIDDENGLLLSQAVVRFSADGQFLGYLGQNGPGGRPFSQIRDVFCVKSDDVVVVSATQKGLRVSWFSSSGFLRFDAEFDGESIPDIFSENQNVFACLDCAIPSQTEEKVFVKADCFEKKFDSKTKQQVDVEYVKTVLFPFDVASGRYGSPIEIPSLSESVETAEGKRAFSRPYDFVGIDADSRLFFFAADESGFEILAFKLPDGKISRRHLDELGGRQAYSAVSIAPDGTICALLAEPSCAKVVWWQISESQDEP